MGSAESTLEGLSERSEGEDHAYLKSVLWCMNKEFYSFFFFKQSRDQIENLGG